MRYAVETGRALCFSIMTCPFCNAETVQNDTMPWCVACRCEYRPARLSPHRSHALSVRHRAQNA